MRPSRARFVTACQQLLALAAVLAVLTPAASVISLDVVQRAPHTVQGSTSNAAARQPAADLSAYSRESSRPTPVPTAPVEADVREYSLTAPAGSKVGTGSLSARTKVGALGANQLVSTPEPVDGYGSVGVTWDRAAEVDDDAISIQARTLDDGSWSDWIDVPYDADHGPDPGSAEATHSRPGTDILLVGKVDEVQVRSTSDTGAQPADMRLAVVAPGTPTATKEELPSIVTDADGVATDTSSGASSSSSPATTGTDADSAALSAATYTPKPKIYSRAQWGANERLRDRGSLHYFEVHAGFVHHTVNANGYSRAEVPGIIRSIYAYHTQSRGWSDVGYNFLVDRFGRIWEGRYGGVDRPVVGAHTLGYNDYAFAMSAIGNFETARPSSAMVQAYGSLFAWKLSLHGITASSTRQKVGPDHFRAINGHRDAGSTACPGRYLYAKIPRIRTLAADAQKGWKGRELESNLASSAHPDLIVRRKSDGKGFVVPTGGKLGFGAGRTSANAWSGRDAVVATLDLTGDRLGDVLLRSTDGSAVVRPNNTRGFAIGIKRTDLFAKRDLITAVGDLDEDGNNDLVARNPATGRLNAFLGKGDGSFRRASMPGDFAGYDLLAATGDVDRDGHVDLLARDRDGAMWRFPGQGTRTLGTPKKLAGRWSQYDTITGYGDFSRDGRPDLVVRRSGGDGYVLPGDGKGDFGRQLGPIGRLKGVSAISGGGNVLGNIAPDVIARKGDDLVSLPHNGRFFTGRPIATGLDLSPMNAVLKAGDWNRDGFGDIVTRRAGSGLLQLRPGNGKGKFGAPIKLAGDFSRVRLLSAVGDMTGDGWPDLMGQPAGGSMRIYPGRGEKGLRASYVAHSAISGSKQIPVGRWDGDGAPDSLFRDGSRLSVYPGNGPGGLTNRRSVSGDMSAYDWVVGVSDVNLVGHSDLIVRQRSTGNLFVIKATSTGLQPRRFLAEGLGGYDLAG